MKSLFGKERGEEYRLDLSNTLTTCRFYSTNRTGGGGKKMLGHSSDVWWLVLEYCGYPNGLPCILERLLFYSGGIFNYLLVRCLDVCLSASE